MSGRKFSLMSLGRMCRRQARQYILLLVSMRMLFCVYGSSFIVLSYRFGAVRCLRGREEVIVLSTGVGVGKKSSKYCGVLWCLFL